MGKFYFENEEKQRLNLQGEDYLIVDLSGLGMSNDTQYTKIGNTFVNHYLDMVQNEIVFGVVFVPPNVHDKLQTFSSFINGAKSLYLIYEPSTTKKVEYRRDVDIVGVTQDTGVRGLLKYNIKLRCRTLFYIQDGESFLIDRASGEMRYNYTFPARFNDNAVRDIVVENDGHVPASIMVEFEGYADTPRLQVFVDGVEVRNLVFERVISEGERLRYSTRDGNLELSHCKSNGQTNNIINSMGLETEVFFKLPIGTSRIQFTSDKEILGKVHFSMYKYYKVV